VIVQPTKEAHHRAETITLGRDTELRAVELVVLLQVGLIVFQHAGHDLEWVVNIAGFKPFAEVRQRPLAGPDGGGRVVLVAHPVQVVINRSFHGRPPLREVM